VIDNVTLGIDATDTIARAAAFVVDASLAGRTVTVENALGSTGWRSSEVVWLARTNRSSLCKSTF
jgi:hypothetical protein